MIDEKEIFGPNVGEAGVALLCRKYGIRHTTVARELAGSAVAYHRCHEMEGGETGVGLHLGHIRQIETLISGSYSHTVRLALDLSSDNVLAMFGTIWIDSEWYQGGVHYNAKARPSLSLGLDLDICVDYQDEAPSIPSDVAESFEDGDHQWLLCLLEERMCWRIRDDGTHYPVLLRPIEQMGFEEAEGAIKDFAQALEKGGSTNE